MVSHADELDEKAEMILGYDEVHHDRSGSHGSERETYCTICFHTPALSKPLVFHNFRRSSVSPAGRSRCHGQRIA
jgi:hypothetical protein